MKGDITLGANHPMNASFPADFEPSRHTAHLALANDLRYIRIRFDATNSDEHPVAVLTLEEAKLLAVRLMGVVERVHELQQFMEGINREPSKPQT